MKLELKKIEHHKGNSQETHCYTANLYYNGLHIATVGNAGHGGCDDLHWTPQSTTPSRETMLRCISEEMREPSAPEFADLYADASPETLLEFWCSDQVNQWLDRRELKRMMSKRVVYTRNDKPGLWQTNTARTAAIRESWARQIKADSTTAVVLNLEPAFEDALKIYREVTSV